MKKKQTEIVSTLNCEDGSVYKITRVGSYTRAELIKHSKEDMDIRDTILGRQKKDQASITKGFELEKARSLPIGTINNHNEIKMPDGKWKYVGKQGHNHPVAKELRSQGHKTQDKDGGETWQSKKSTNSTTPHVGSNAESEKKGKSVLSKESLHKKYPVIKEVLDEKRQSIDKISGIREYMSGNSLWYNIEFEGNDGETFSGFNRTVDASSGSDFGIEVKKYLSDNPDKKISKPTPIKKSTPKKTESKLPKGFTKKVSKPSVGMSFKTESGYHEYRVSKVYWDGAILARDEEGDEYSFEKDEIKTLGFKS